MHTEEWVECPYCRRVIQAPNEPDVTFSCPDCGRELITYSKEEVNNALTVEVPTEIDKWNWGAFIFGTLWGLFNGVYWPLIFTLVICVLDLLSDFSIFMDIVWIISSIAISIILGINGNKLAWKAKPRNDIAKFLKVQHNWMVAGLVFVFVTTVIWFAIIEDAFHILKGLQSPE